MFRYPRPEFFLECAQPKEEMLGFAQRGRGSGHHRHGIPEVHGRIGGAAVLAGVAVLIRGATGRALAAHVAIRQEHAPLLVVGLGDDPAVDVSVLLEAPIHLPGEFQVFRGVRRLVVVDADPESLENPSDALLQPRRPTLRGRCAPRRPATSSAFHGRRWRKRRCSGGRACAGIAPRCRSGCIPPGAPGAAVRWHRAGRW